MEDGWWWNFESNSYLNLNLNGGLVMSKKRILTGDRPTSRLHIGHYVGSLENRVKLQEEFEQFVIIADVQALTTHFEHPKILKQNVHDLCIDYLSVGIDPSWLLPKACRARWQCKNEQKHGKCHLSFRW